MRRSVWQLFARSGERKYFDYGRRYTRFMHDLIFSNTDTSVKPLGWFVQGHWHSPIVWGHFGDGKAPKGYKPRPYNSKVALTLASSADMVQFVYDYFLTGDLHSRDMAYHWKNAMIKEMKFDVKKALGLFRPDCFIRMLSAAYELDQDPRLLEYGRKIVRAIVPERGPEIFRPRSESGARINYDKAGEIFSAFYYYHVATRDPLVKDAFVRLARSVCRRNAFGQFFSRGSPLLQAFVFAHEETGEGLFAAWLNQAVTNFGRNRVTLADEGIDLDKLSQNTTTYFGRASMVGQAPITVGLPVAMAAVASLKKPPPDVPIAVKTHPTQRTYVFLRKKPGPADIVLYVNNWGHTNYAPTLLDLAGKNQKLEVLERCFKHVTEPECYDQNSIWVHKYADHFFYRLRIPASVPAGVYELDLGDEVNFNLMYTEAPDGLDILQVAPDGTVLQRGRRYHFVVPEGAEMVDYFAHRPVRIYDPAGKPVAAEALKNGRYRFSTDGKRGAWSVQTLDDKYTTGATCANTFFRIDGVEFVNGKRWYPLVVALDDPDKLFSVDVRRFKPASERMPRIAPLEYGSAFVEPSAGADFGKALHLNRHFVEVGIAAADPGEELLPHKRGTVEFWFRPLWSATDCHMETLHDSTHRTQFFKADPVSISYSIDPDNGGRTGRYNLVKLLAQIKGVGYTQANIYLEQGKWYHIAVTWNVDGQANAANIFINGRKKAYSLYKPGMNKKAPPVKLGLPARSMRIGVGDWYGHRFVSGLIDELRISRTIRYTQHYTVPRAPFRADADTVLLMHFDGDTTSVLNGRAVSGKIKPGRLW